MVRREASSWDLCNVRELRRIVVVVLHGRTSRVAESIATAALLLRVSECLRVVRLGSGLGRALLLLSADEGAVVDGGIVSLLRLVVQALRSFPLLHY